MEYIYNSVLVNDLFTRALNSPESSACSAWICANDFIALAAMEFLKTAPAKGKIAIIGFDDIPAATINDLTSYSFMPSIVVETALGYIINPRQEYF